MDGIEELAGLAERSRSQTRQLDSAVAAALGTRTPYEPTEREITAAEGAVRAYRKGKSKPRIREEIRRTLKAAQAVRQ